MSRLSLLEVSSSTIKNSICLAFALSLCACSTTMHKNNNTFADHHYDANTANEPAMYSKFTSANTKVSKKILHSDHHLMMSLLNRPITADQAMMLNFAQKRESYYPSSHYAVAIKGNKSSDKSNSRAVHAYASLISQDINAVTITAPK